MPSVQRIRQALLWPFRRLINSLRSQWHEDFQRLLYEHRYHRQLLSLIVLLLAVTLVPSIALLALVYLLGFESLILDRAFVQNLLASILVLPASITLGVFAVTVLQKQSLRFQFRNAGETLRDRIGLEAFKFALYLKFKCNLPVNHDGPFDSQRIEGIRKVLDTSWDHPLPATFRLELNNMVNSISACFHGFGDMRLAYPKAFDGIDRLRVAWEKMYPVKNASVTDSHAALIVYFHVIEILRDFE